MYTDSFNESLLYRTNFQLPCNKHVYQFISKVCWSHQKPPQRKHNLESLSMSNDNAGMITKALKVEAQDYRESLRL